jgi:hypothetical protein
VNAKYLKFTISFEGEPMIEATMGWGQPHYTLCIIASPIDKCIPIPCNDKELTFLAKMHMMNSALNQALEGLGDYDVYADVIRLQNGRRKANELEKQKGHIEALEVFMRQQWLHYEHQWWEHVKCQKEVRMWLIQVNAHSYLQALIREEPELGECKHEPSQIGPFCL